MNTNIDNLEEMAELLKVMAHPVRLCIIKGLIDKGSCNVSYMQNCLKTPQSTVSQHLQKLKAAKIIKGERSGLEINYSICNEHIKRVINCLFK